MNRSNVLTGTVPMIHKALECLTQFVANADGVAVDAEVLVYSQRLEVHNTTGSPVCTQ